MAALESYILCIEQLVCSQYKDLYSRNRSLYSRLYTLLRQGSRVLHFCYTCFLFKICNSGKRKKKQIQVRLTPQGIFLSVVQWLFTSGYCSHQSGQADFQSGKCLEKLLCVLRTVDMSYFTVFGLRVQEDKNGE